MSGDKIEFVAGFAEHGAEGAFAPTAEFS